MALRRSIIAYKKQHCVLPLGPRVFSLKPIVTSVNASSILQTHFSAPVEPLKSGGGIFHRTSDPDRPVNKGLVKNDYFPAHEMAS